MRKLCTAVTLATAMGIGPSFAGKLEVSTDLNFSGGFASSYFYMFNNGSDPSGHDSIRVSDFIIEVDTGEIKGTGVSFLGALGTRNSLTVLSQTPSANDTGWEGVDFDWGYATWKLMEPITIDAGVIGTTIGNEVSPSYANGNILRGFLWNSQPSVYNGIRGTYNLGELSVAGEINHDTSQGSSTGATNFALNLAGSAENINYSVSYYDGKDSKNIVALLVSTSIGSMDVAADVNFYMIDDAPSGTDDSAIGIALYVTQKIDKMEYPIRVEYVSDGTSGIYGGVDSGFSLTITPTYHYSKNAFVRAEVSFASSSEDIFTDGDGELKSAQTIIGGQIGFTF